MFTFKFDQKKVLLLFYQIDSTKIIKVSYFTDYERKIELFFLIYIFVCL